MDKSLDWSFIDVVLLDMDGTLLDLHFDNYFWQEFVPERYAEKQGLDLEQAKAKLSERYHSVEGTMQWYCVDYWSDTLNLDIAYLKSEVRHLIKIHPHVIQFLKSVKNINKYLVLVTNAHQKSLALKMEKTQLNHYFDRIICAHDIGIPKENHAFWMKLQKKVAYDPQHTMLVDDSLSVLKSAHQYGIRYLFDIIKPDTQKPSKIISDFTCIADFKEITPQPDTIRVW